MALSGKDLNNASIVLSNIAEALRKSANDVTEDWKDDLEKLAQVASTLSMILTALAVFFPRSNS